MFHPSGPGIDLLEFLGSYANYLPLAVKNYGSGTRGSLIQGHDIFSFHNLILPETGLVGRIQKYIISKHISREASSNSLDLPFQLRVRLFITSRPF